MAPNPAAQKFLKAKGLSPAQWKAKTQARFAANHPQPLFPSVDVTPKEQRGVLQNARQQVTQTYAATPMPALTSYLQPFADAHARISAAGDNYRNYLASASQNAQNMTGAFQGALGAGIAAGQESVVGQGGSGSPSSIPTAQASLIPAASVGSSFSGYLNALTPYVGAAVQETDRQLNQQQSRAVADYQQSAAARQADIRAAIDKLYTSGLSTLQDSKANANKAAVTEYLAMGKTAYQKAQNAERTRYDSGRLAQSQQKIKLQSQKQASDKAYKQATLDQKRTQAAVKGIDLAPAYKVLFVSKTTPGAPGAKTGPAGQTGGQYTIQETRTDSLGNPTTSTVTQFVPYGKKVPKSVTFTNPDGTTVTRKVTLKSQVMPKASASSSARVATPASWDRAVSLLRNKYPGRITPAWLKQNFPPRPKGT